MESLELDPKNKIYLGEMPLFYLLAVLGLFECYLGLRKDVIWSKTGIIFSM